MRAPKRCPACRAKYNDRGHHCVKKPGTSWPNLCTMDVESAPKSHRTGTVVDYHQEAAENIERWLKVSV